MYDWQALSSPALRIRTIYWLAVAAVLMTMAGGPRLTLAQASAAGGASNAPAAVTIAQQGKAALPIIVSADADPAVRATAEQLASYLGKITGGQFVIETGDGSSGIVLGEAKNFPALDLVAQFEPGNALRREEYVLRSSARGLLLIGATPLAVQDASWDLLRRLGYRQFFPGPTWEVIPHSPTLTLTIDRFEKPSFLTRRIWYGHGVWDYNKQPYADWCNRNRALPGFNLATAHSYGAIIRHNKADFQAHPEYLALVNGKRQGSKFCISNPDLRKLVIEKYVLPYFENNPDKDCISLEPSDGGGSCECEECAKLGSISDRTLLLANEAADALVKVYPDKYVGLLAYNMHSPPPTIRVHPHVIIKVQTSFIRGGYSFDDLITGWARQGAVTGVGDYYSVFVGDMSRPAEQKGSDLYYIRHAIPRFHKQGARFFMTESGDVWGAIGLSHYIAAQLLWDVSQESQVDDLLQDFYAKAFGAAHEPMEKFYRLIYRIEPEDRRPLIRKDMLARMYRFLQQARQLAANDPQVMGRLNDLTLYTRYEDLFQASEALSGAARQRAAEAVVRHVWQMRQTMMVHAKPLLWNKAGRFVLKNRGLQPMEDSVVQVDHTFTTAELTKMVDDGVAHTQTVEMGFEPVDFNDDLVPVTALHLPAVADGDYNQTAPIGRQKFHTWLDQPGDIQLKVSGGYIVHYRKIASNVQVRLYAEANPIVGEQIAYDDSVPPDGSEKIVTLTSRFDGLHHMEILPPANRAKVITVDPALAWTMDASFDLHNALSGVWSLYFYVPKGTKIVGGFASTRTGSLLDGSGNVVLSFTKDIKAPAFFKVVVPRGQDGKLWKFANCTGQRALLTVPPYLAKNGQQLLLPAEVVKADAKK